MDPVSLEVFLSVCDGIETTRQGDSLSYESFSSIVNRISQAQDKLRRARDIYRIFQGLNWLSKDDSFISLNGSFHEFIDAWNRASLSSMNNLLASYSPYNSFLNCLRSQSAIEIPQRGDKPAKDKLNKWLQSEYKITFVAFDTFRFWATALGQAYKSPFRNILFWGGEWGATTPSLEILQSTLWNSYLSADKESGYANIGQLADEVCRKLQISFSAFEIKLNELVKARPTLFTFASVTRRYISSDHAMFPSIRPRLEVLREKTRMQMLHPNLKHHRISWISRRYLEDGVRINNRLMRLIRWETQYDTEKRSGAPSARYRI